MKATRRGTEATRVRLNVSLFDRLAEKRGATTPQERADLMQVDRATYYRYRNGEYVPGLDVAMSIAKRLDVRVDKLWLRDEPGDES